MLITLHRDYANPYPAVICGHGAHATFMVAKDFLRPGPSGALRAIGFEPISLIPKTRILTIELRLKGGPGGGPAVGPCGVPVIGGLVIIKITRSGPVGPRGLPAPRGRTAAPLVTVITGGRRGAPAPQGGDRT